MSCKHLLEGEIGDNIGIMKQYDARTIGVDEIRGTLDLDPLRHDEYPDDLRAVLTREGLNPE